MKCENCPALGNNSGYEHDADEWWCNLGEEDKEFNDGSTGCNRKSLSKIKRDLEIARKIDAEAFATECGKFCESMVISK